MIFNFVRKVWWKLTKNNLMFWLEIRHVDWSEMTEFTVLVVRVTSKKSKSKARILFDTSDFSNCVRNSFVIASLQLIHVKISTNLDSFFF